DLRSRRRLRVFARPSGAEIAASRSSGSQAKRMFDSWGLPSRFRVASTPWLVVVNRLARASASMFSQAPAADEVFRARRRQLPALTWPGVRHRSVVAPRSGRPQLLAHDDDDGDGAVPVPVRCPGSPAPPATAEPLRRPRAGRW